MTIINVETGLLCMELRHWDIAGGCIRAHNRGPEPRHGFAQKSTTATDVQDSQALKGQSRLQITAKFSGNLLADIIQTAGVEHVQGFKLAFKIPPFRGHRFEFCDFSRVDCRLVALHSDLHMDLT